MVTELQLTILDAQAWRTARGARPPTALAPLLQQEFAPTRGESYTGSSTSQAPRHNPSKAARPPLSQAPKWAAVGGARSSCSSGGPARTHAWLLCSCRAARADAAARLAAPACAAQLPPRCPAAICAGGQGLPWQVKAFAGRGEGRMPAYKGRPAVLGRRAPVQAHACCRRSAAPSTLQHVCCPAVAMVLGLGGAAWWYFSQKKGIEEKQGEPTLVARQRSPAHGRLPPLPTPVTSRTPLLQRPPRRSGARTARRQSTANLSRSLSTTRRTSPACPQQRPTLRAGTAAAPSLEPVWRAVAASGCCAPTLNPACLKECGPLSYSWEGHKSAQAGAARVWGGTRKTGGDGH